MAAFADHLSEGPELDLLHVMGLFDRPADAGCIEALRKEPAVPGLNDRLLTLDETGWRDLLEELRDLGLLAEKSNHAPDDLDAHPLVREHFGTRLRKEREEAWKAGHERLYKYLQTVPEKHQPDILADMAPLFQAVHHGCQAGRQQEVFQMVYYERIFREAEGYLIRKLGAHGVDLGLLASFFDPPFDHPVGDFTEPTRAHLLNQVAARLRALGHLDEAGAPVRAGLKMRVEQGKWKQAAAYASNLSELQLALGNIAAAEAAGEAAVGYADRDGDAFQCISNRTTFANAQHQAGDLAAAQELFDKTKAMQLERQRPGSDYARLFSLPGYRYCDLLLTLGEPAAVRELADCALKASLTYRTSATSLLDIALDHLSLGRAAQALGDLDEACSQLDQAVDGLRMAGTIHYIPHGLLARAALFREVDDCERARKYLDEVMRLATRCGMRLHECDAHLEYARLALDEGNPEAAVPHFNSASSLVNQCGYHRRDPEIKELREKLGLGVEPVG